MPLPPHTNQTGGANGPWVGPPEPRAQRRPSGGWWGPPVRGSNPRHPPSTCRHPQTPPSPPPVPHPGWGGAARACGSSPRRPLLHYTDSAGRQESGGAPHCPERPPPRRLALEAKQRLAGCCAGRAGRPGASYPPPTGVCAHGTGHRRRLGGTTPPPTTAPQAPGRGNSPGHRPPPSRRKVPTARLILAPHFLFMIIPLGRPGPQSPRRVSSWGRNLRTSVTEKQAVVSHPADVGSLCPHGAPGHPGHLSRG